MLVQDGFLYLIVTRHKLTVPNTICVSTYLPIKIIASTLMFSPSPLSGMALRW